MTDTFYPADLHFHTHFSDGRFSPEAMLRFAAAHGVRTVAITDHDNFNAYAAAHPLARELSLRLIPGIEFTTHWPAPTPNCPPGEGEIDLLGYGFDPHDATFQTFARQSQADLAARIETCCDLLCENGKRVTPADMHAQNPRAPGLAQLVSAMLALGLAPTWDACVALMRVAWEQVRPPATSMATAITQIHRAGGVAVLAHPAIIAINGADTWITAGDLALLVDAGLDGIEIYHFRLKPDARAYFSALAQNFGLLITGGSDEHGLDSHNGDLPYLGRQPVTEALAEALLARCACKGS